MLPLSLVNEIDHLLRDGQLSHRKIAARLGVSRSTVNSIANGRRGLYGREPVAKPSPLEPTSAPARCSACGYRVYLPCRICRARELKQRQIVEQLYKRCQEPFIDSNTADVVSLRPWDDRSESLPVVLSITF